MRFVKHNNWLCGEIPWLWLMDGAFSSMLNGAGVRDREIKHACAMPDANFLWNNKRERSDTGCAKYLRMLFANSNYYGADGSRDLLHKINMLSQAINCNKSRTGALSEIVTCSTWKIYANLFLNKSTSVHWNRYQRTSVLLCTRRDICISLYARAISSPLILSPVASNCRDVSYDW